MKSDVSNQDSYATTLPTSFLDTSNSDITTGVVSTWDAKISIHILQLSYQQIHTALMIMPALLLQLFL